MLTRERFHVSVLGAALSENWLGPPIKVTHTYIKCDAICWIVFGHTTFEIRSRDKPLHYLTWVSITERWLEREGTGYNFKCWDLQMSSITYVNIDYSRQNIPWVFLETQETAVLFQILQRLKMVTINLEPAAKRSENSLPLPCSWTKLLLSLPTPKASTC